MPGEEQIENGANNKTEDEIISFEEVAEDASELISQLREGKKMLDDILVQSRMASEKIAELGKLPRKKDRLKVELSGIIRSGGSDEKVEVYGDEDHIDLARSGLGAFGQGSLPQPRYQPINLLHVEIEVRRDESI